MPTHLAVEADNISGWVWGSNPWVCGGPWPRLGSMARAKYITMCLEEKRVPDFKPHLNIINYFCLINIFMYILRPKNFGLAYGGQGQIHHNVSGRNESSGF